MTIIRSLKERKRISLEIIVYDQINDDDPAIAFQRLHPDGCLSDFYGEFLDTEEVIELVNTISFCSVIENHPIRQFQIPEYKPRDLTDLQVARIKWQRLSKKYKPLVFEKYGEICQDCGSTENITIDHIIPLSKGGTSELNNLQPLCKSCNSKKGIR